MSRQAGRAQPAVRENGVLGVGDGHSIYWETWGNAEGKPALFVHGGPGSGFGTVARRCFDPDAFWVVQFDQRGCGRSTPYASEPNIDLATNTTAHLLADIELLRKELGIARWLVLGGSWGSTLALAYAERHPDRVSEMVLFSIATSTLAEIDWITRGVGMFFPEAYARFRAGAAISADENIVDAYHRLLMDSDPAVHEKAARDWCEWEDAIVKLRAHDPPDPRYQEPRFRLAFARLVTHYWRHAAWLPDGMLLRDVGRLDAVPGVLVHGRLDIGSPLTTAWQLNRAWPGSELIVVDEAGHGVGFAPMAAEIRAATDRFAGS